MKIIAIIVTIICCCLMFVVRRETKAALLVMGAMTLTLVEVPGVPLYKANLLLQVSFLVSEWDQLLRHIMLLRKRPWLAGLLLLACFTALLAALTSPYVGVFSFLRSELLFKYFALAYAFWAVRGEKSLEPMLRVTLCCLIVLTIVGVINYLSRSAYVVNALTAGRTSTVYEDIALGDVYTESSRFRVQSLFRSPFDYGYTCLLILLLHLYAWHRRMENWQMFAVAMVCSLFGIITCECRVVWISSILSVGFFYLWSFPLNRNVVIGILAIFLFIISYSTIGVVERKVDKLTDIFKENPRVSGSSINLRMAQFKMTLRLIEGQEALGRGQGYFSKSWANDIGNVEGLQGLESVVFHHLLERGVIGFVLWVVFYAWLFYVFWRDRKRYMLLTGLGLSILIAYLSFAVGTGELRSVYPTLLLLGVVLKVLEHKKKIRKLVLLLILLMYGKKSST